MNFPDPAILYFSQVGAGEGIISDGVFTNPSEDNTALATVNFYDDNGDPLLVDVASAVDNRYLASSNGPDFVVASSVDIVVPPLSAVTISTSPDGELAVGAMEVDSNYPLGGVVRFSLPDRGIAGVGAGEPVTGFISPVRRTEGGINTGVALHNIGTGPVDIALSLRTTADGEVATANIEDFAGRGHLAKFISELFPNADTSDFEGSLVAKVTGGSIVATVLELGTQPGQFTTLPVTPLE